MSVVSKNPFDLLGGALRGVAGARRGAWTKGRQLTLRRRRLVARSRPQDHPGRCFRCRRQEGPERR